MYKGKQVVKIASTMIIAAALWAVALGVADATHKDRSGEPRVYFEGLEFPETSVQGDFFKFTVSFRLLKELLMDENIFFHLVDSETKNIVLNADFISRNPTSSWEVGEVVNVGPVNFSIPDKMPPGRYLIECGLYEAVDPGKEGVNYIRERFANDGINDHFIGEATVKAVEEKPEEGPKRMLIADFGNEKSFGLWETQSCLIEMTEGEGTEGDKALKATFLSGEQYSSFFIGEYLRYATENAGDWSEYGFFSFKAKIPGKAMRKVYIKFRDGNDRMYQGPIDISSEDWKNYKVDLLDVSGVVDISNIVEIKFFTVRPMTDIVVLFNDVALEQTTIKGNIPLTFVELKIPGSVKKNNIVSFSAIFQIARRLTIPHKLRIAFIPKERKYGEPEHAAKKDYYLLVPIEKWDLNQDTEVGPYNFFVPETVKPGIYRVELFFYFMIDSSPYADYVKISDQIDSKTGEKVFYLAQPTGPVDYIKEPYTNEDITGWIVGEIRVEE